MFPEAFFLAEQLADYGWEGLELNIRPLQDLQRDKWECLPLGPWAGRTAHE